MSLKSLVNVSQTAFPFQHDCNSGGASSYWPYFATVTLFILLVYSRRESYPNLPRLNPKKPTELTWRSRLLDWLGRSAQLMDEGNRQFPDQPYKIYTESGDGLIIPPKYVNELRSNRALEFADAASDVSHSYVPGFEPFANHPGMVKVVQNYLTKALVSLTAPISQEATIALRDVFKETQEWNTVTPDDIMLVVSRMSSRIFMGEELCSDKEWLETSSQYVAASVRTAFELRKWPRALRPVVHWFLPGFSEVRQRLRRCQDVLKPHIDRRMALKEAATARGEPNPFNDSIEWFARETTGHYDPAAIQISLSMVAIHTTTDLLMQTIIDIAKHPEIIGPLREEVIQVLTTDGLKKSAFQKLKLMDSCCKESQRLRPIHIANFQRMAVSDVKLKDGFVLKKGTHVRMDGRKAMLDEKVYPEPLRWDPYRFMRMREAGEEHKANLVSTTPEHVGFGHGIHACPGRFFAANEIKIALAHILLKYDWKLAEGQEHLHATAVGSFYVMPHDIKLLVRRRKEELDIDSLES